MCVRCQPCHNKRYVHVVQCTVERGDFRGGGFNSRFLPRVVDLSMCVRVIMCVCVCEHDCILPPSFIVHVHGCGHWLGHLPPPYALMMGLQ